MDILNERLDIARKIAEELLGTITEENRDALARWKAKSKKHQAEYDEICSYLTSGEKIWEELEEAECLANTRWNHMQYSRKRKRDFIRWSQYAAVIALVFTAVLYFQTQKEQPIQAPIASNRPITPGKAKAILTLDDGQKIELNDSTFFSLQESDGTKISKQGDIMTYTTPDTIVAGNKYNTLTVPRGGEHSIVLADGTRVWLNSESSLTYPVHFSDSIRQVEMTGEACFEVAKNTAKPFIVKSKDVYIRVLGTYFNVSAYNPTITTTLIEGRVELCQGKHKVLLLPNRQAVLNGNKFEIRQVDARNSILWKEGIFFFEDTPLENILDAMARWYDVQIVYVNPSVRNTRYSVKVKRYASIEEILRRIAQTNRVSFEVKNRIVNVYEKSR